VFSFDPFFGF